jgi:hypothetical protein
MLEYSGTLLHGLRRAGLDGMVEALRPLACDPGLRRTVEWLGCPWGHAVAPSTQAKGLSRRRLAGRRVPPLVTQIADGENGGVVMNEFPPVYLEVVRACSGSARRS